MDAYSGDERVPEKGRSGGSRGGRGGRSAAAPPHSQQQQQQQHPARLLDREDARHYSGFLGQMSASEELSMDVPDLLASLLELGGAVPNAAARGGSPAPPTASRARVPPNGGHWESSAEAPAPKRARERHHRPELPQQCTAGQSWDGREQWETPTVAHHGSRRPIDAPLPLHEAWMQHEAEWANMHGLRHPASQVRPHPALLCGQVSTTTRFICH